MLFTATNVILGIILELRPVEDFEEVSNLTAHPVVQIGLGGLQVIV